MAIKFESLKQAIHKRLASGMTVAMGGFSHLVPYSAAHEILLSRFDRLTLVRLVPDILADQMIGAGAVDGLVFSWAGNPGYGLLPRFRDAVENGWPTKLELSEHTHAELANRFVAGASKIPFTVMRGSIENDLKTVSDDTRREISCPFTGTPVTAVSALNPDIGIIHAQFADRNGNVMSYGVGGVDKEVVLASNDSIATVEHIVDRLPEHQTGTTIPGWAIGAICHAPLGASPSYAMGEYPRDLDTSRGWKQQASSRADFEMWLNRLLASEDGNESDGQ